MRHVYSALWVQTCGMRADAVILMFKKEFYQYTSTTQQKSDGAGLCNTENVKRLPGIQPVLSASQPSIAPDWPLSDGEP